MIPDFLTAKPSTNQNAADAPAIPDSKSTEQFKDNGAFQKALRKESSDRSAAQRSSPNDETDPAPTANEPRSNSQPRSIPERQTDRVNHRVDSNKRPESAKNDERANQIELPNSNSADDSVSDDASAARLDSSNSANASNETSAEARKSSKLIRRIDPANHSNSNDRVDALPSDAAVQEEVLNQTADLVLPDFQSSDSSDIGSLPSLIRLLGGRPSPEQSSAGELSENVSSDKPGDSTLSSDVSANLEPPEPDEGLRPFLNDALIPDDDLAETNSRFTATAPALVVDAFQEAPVNNGNSVTNDELLTIPTLPSLRPDSSQKLSATENAPGNNDRQDTSVVGRSLLDESAGRDPVEPEQAVADTLPTTLIPNVSSTVHEFELELPSGVAAKNKNNKQAEQDLPLVLPSLTSVRTRNDATFNDGVTQPLENQQLNKGKDSVNTVAQNSVAVASKSTQHAPLKSDISGDVTVDESAVASQTQSSEPAETTQRSAEEKPQRPAQSLNAASFNTTVETQSNVDTQVEIEPESSQEPDRKPLEIQRLNTKGDVENTSSIDGGSNETDRQEKAVTDGPQTVAESATSNTGQPSPLVSGSDRNVENTVVKPTQKGTGRPDNTSSSPSSIQVDTPAVSVTPEGDGPVPVESSGTHRTERVKNPALRDQTNEQPQEVVNTQPNGEAFRQGESPQSRSNFDRAPVDTERSTLNRHRASSTGGSQQVQVDKPQASGLEQSNSGEFDAKRSQVASENAQTRLRKDSDVEGSASDSSSSFAAVEQSRPANSPTVQPPVVPENSSEVTSVRPALDNDVTGVSTTPVPTETSSVDAASVSVDAASVSNSQPSATVNAGPPTATTRPEVVRAPAVPMEIQDAVSAIQEAASGDSHLRVRLNPRELGNMLVDVSRTDTGVVARLEVESAAARVAVMETLPDLQQSLSRSGSSVDRIEVVLTETRAEAGRQESGQPQQGEQQSRQERQSSNQQQARDEQNQRREQSQRREQQEDHSPTSEESGEETPDQIDIKL